MRRRSSQVGRTKTNGEKAQGGFSLLFPDMQRNICGALLRNAVAPVCCSQVKPHFLEIFKWTAESQNKNSRWLIGIPLCHTMTFPLVALIINHTSILRPTRLPLFHTLRQKVVNTPEQVATKVKKQQQQMFLSYLISLTFHGHHWVCVSDSLQLWLLELVPGQLVFGDKWNQWG